MGKVAKAKNDKSHESLVSLAAYLSMGLSLGDDELLKLIMEIGVGMMRADEGSLLLLDREREELEFMMTIGPAESSNMLKGQRFSMHQGITGLAASTGEPQTGSPTYHGVKMQERGVGQRQEPTAVLAAPMLAEEEVVGVITAVSFIEGRTFSPADVELYCKFSNLCGNVIRQRLREEAVRQILLGEEGKATVPGDIKGLLAAHSLAPADRAVAEIARSLGKLSKGRDDILPLCAEMVHTVAKIAGELGWKS
jgi:GAF domain-containing protein